MTETALKAVGTPLASIPVFKHEDVPALYENGQTVLSAVNKHKGLIPDLKTKAGYEAVRVAVRELITARTGVEARRKELKRGAIDFGKAVDAEAHRLTDMIVEIEEPLAEAKGAHDADIKRQKEEAAAAEQSRIDAIREAIHGWLHLPLQLDRSNVEAITAALETVTAELARLDDPQTSEQYQEFTPRAIEVLHETEVAVSGMREEAEQSAKLAAEREAEQERQATEAAKLAAEREFMQAERKKLEQQKAEVEAERQRIERQHAAREAEDIRLREEEAAAKELERKVRDAEVEAHDIHTAWLTQMEAKKAHEQAEAKLKKQAAIAADAELKPQVVFLTEWGTSLAEYVEKTRADDFPVAIKNEALQDALELLLQDVTDRVRSFIAEIN